MSETACDRCGRAFDAGRQWSVCPHIVLGPNTDQIERATVDAIGPVRTSSDIVVELVQRMGDDATICRAARVSTVGNQVDLDTSKDSGLINYLMRSRHGSPFEHGSLTVRVHAPIKVWREWHRHRIGWSYNEESGRYKELEPLFYVPPRDRPSIRPVDFKSSRPDFVLMTDEQYAETIADLIDGYGHAYGLYRRMLDRGVDRGLARDVLGVGIYSTCYCTANPRSVMAFLELRTRRDDARRPSRPLYEIAVAAERLELIFAETWPITYAAWLANGRMAP